jgi:transcriptional regulator with PAS, ATPase and Fis domain|tara:strand:- start:3537 stop:4544 length:1008 start_codon:yes stop_codon:yes gene_type:complete
LRERLAIEGDLAQRTEFCGMIGRGPGMQELFDLIRRLAPHVRTALITGETGTGKELVARALHHEGPRRVRKFITINCSAVVETLFESELFGHVRGAFTGATENKVGMFEQAHGGTLFLDEVGELPALVQAKLLRTLEAGEVQRVGSLEQRRVDVRVIAATNSNLTQLVAEGTFREDLFYRLNVIPIPLPPLRDRREDIPILTQHFLERLGRDLVPPRPNVGVSQEAMRQLMAYAWPGNIRQLENVVERTLAFSQGRTQIDVADLPPEIQAAAEPGLAVRVAFPDDGIDFENYVHDVERELIRQALRRADGNKRRAADLLQLKRTTLLEKMKRLQP